MNKPLIAGAIALSLAFGSTGAFAQSADLTTWTSAGDVQGLAPTSVSFTTAAMDSGEVPASGFSALLFNDLESALGLPAGSLPGETFEGSGLASTFTVAGPTAVSFQWTLSTADLGALDQAFMIVDGTYQSFTFDPLDLVRSPISGTFTTTFLTGGDHSLAFGVMDVDDVTGVSTLSVSNFAVTAVPEPGSFAMMLAGLGALGALARRRRV